MSDVFGQLREARLAAWTAGLELAKLWDACQVDPSGSADAMARQIPLVDQAIENVRDALTLGCDAPRPSAVEAKIDVMMWGLDEGLISGEQYDEWVASEPDVQAALQRKK